MNPVDLNREFIHWKIFLLCTWDIWDGMTTLDCSQVRWLSKIRNLCNEQFTVLSVLVLLQLEWEICVKKSSSYQSRITESAFLRFSSNMDQAHIWGPNQLILHLYKPHWLILYYKYMVHSKTWIFFRRFYFSLQR